MKKISRLAVVLLVAAAAWAQTAVPRGTILPVALMSSINTRKVHAGQKIKAEIMQDVPAAGHMIPRRTKVVGHVIYGAATNNGGSSLSLKFDYLQLRSEVIAIVTDLRAIASFMAVYDAQLPLTGPDRGTSDNAWTTVQVGGDVVYRGGGPVTSDHQVVGMPVVGGGVLVHITARPGSPCRGPLDGDQPQALWVFSSDACGIYGFNDLMIRHAGRTAPIGEIVLTSTRKDLKLPAGTGLLLRVEAPQK